MLLRLLLWENIFLIIFFTCIWSFFINTDNLISLLLNSEYLIIILFCLLANLSVIYNLNIVFGIALSFLILGGLEIALNLILLII